MKRAYLMFVCAIAAMILLTLLVIEHGAGNVSIIVLMVICAYLNVLLLTSWLKSPRQFDKRCMLVSAGTLFTNIALLYLTNLNILIYLVAWIPVIAGCVAVAFARRR